MANVTVKENGGEKPKKEGASEAVATQNTPAPSNMSAADVKELFILMSQQNAEVFKEIVASIQKTDAASFYRPDQDVPNPNIPPDCYIKGGRRLLIPLNKTCITPYSIEGVHQPHPQGKKLVFFRFSHDIPIMRDGRPDKLPFCGYTTFDTREEQWIRRSVMGPVVLDDGKEGGVSKDRTILSVMVRQMSHYASLPVESLYREAELYGVAKTQDIEGIRSELARKRAEQLIGEESIAHAQAMQALTKNQLMEAEI